MKKVVHGILICLTLSLSLEAQVNITFELNTATIQTIDPSGIYIAGGTGFGSPGDNMLTDPDGDGIYTITIQRDAAFSSFYTFTNGSCGDYSCKENLAGLPCSDPANYNDRFLPPVYSDTTILACFGTCDSDGSCTIVTDSIDITFELNTENIDMIDPSGVYLAGGGNFGNPGDNPMIDPEGDGIYTITIRKPMGFASYYTFTNGACGDWSCKEDLQGLPCADPNSFNDRYLAATFSDTTIQACFGNCASDGSCVASNTVNKTNAPGLVTLSPTVVSTYTQLIFEKEAVMESKNFQVFTASGELVLSVENVQETTCQIDATSLPAGLYYVCVQSADHVQTLKFVVQ